MLTKQKTGKNKKPRNPCGSEVFLVRGTGLEPVTPCTSIMVHKYLQLFMRS
nr:MAG TPA: hypothetical protein [Caudoviricetes sp.]